MQQTICPVYEFRKLILCGQKFLTGKESYASLNGSASECLFWVRVCHSDNRIKEIAEEWSVMINHSWNEWGLEKQPVTNEEFRQWLTRQLS